MASVLQVATIKDQGGNANAIEIANSSANVTINNLTSSTGFPAGHVVQTTRSGSMSQGSHGTTTSTSFVDTGISVNPPVTSGSNYMLITMSIGGHLYNGQGIDFELNVSYNGGSYARLGANNQPHYQKREGSANTYEVFNKKHPIGTIIEGEIVNKNEYSLFVKIKDLDIDAFLHCNDLTYLNNGEEELNKYKKGEKIKVKVLEIKVSEQKIRVGFRQTKPDPLDFFNEKKVNQTITVKVISTDNKGLTVRPEGCEMDFLIKKSQIAINASDARPNRWTGGEKLDCAIADLDLDKRKVTLSIKLLEEIEKKEALEKYGSEGSGKNLPFSSLSEDLKKKEEEKE